jgi:hypothetical protein
MSKRPMRGHFRYLRFKTFPMTPRTPQCEVFCPLLSSSEHSGVPEDSKSPLFQVLGFTPTLDQVRVATIFICILLSCSNLMFHTTFQKFHHTTSSTSFHGEVNAHAGHGFGPKMSPPKHSKIGKKKTKMIRPTTLILLTFFGLIMEPQHYHYYYIITVMV